MAASSWFTASARSGALEISLDQQSCFNAEVYAADLGLETSAEPDLRLNLGERLLHALFHRWAEVRVIVRVRVRIRVRARVRVRVRVRVRARVRARARARARVRVRIRIRIRVRIGQCQCWG